MEAKNDEKTEEPQAAGAEPEPEQSMSSWFSGWYDTAKKKLAETNEFMKHDIQEFTQAVQTDASKLVAATATTMKEKLNINVDLGEASAATRVVKDSLSSFLGNIASKVGPQRPDDDDDDSNTAFVGTASGTKVMSPAEARIYAIRTDPATYCNEPDSESEFHMWLPDFNLEEKKNEISSLMLDVAQIRSIYTKLVPNAVSHCDFWTRYFFKIHQHEKAEERRALLVERAHKTHDDIEWEDDEDDDWVQPDKTPDPLKSISQPNNKGITEDAPKNQKQATEKSPSRKQEVTFEKPDEKTEDAALPNAETEKESEVGKLETVEVAAPETVPMTATEKKSLPVTPKEELKQIPADNVVIAEIAAASSENPVVEARQEPKEEPHEVLEDVSTKESISNEQSNREIKTPEIRETDPAVSKPTTGATSSTDKTAATKTPSSEESSDDWEKDFDLDMTEDEIQEALKESDKIDVDDIGEDWENWE